VVQPGHPLLEDHVAVTTLKLEQPSTQEEEGILKPQVKTYFHSTPCGSPKKWKQMDGSFDNERGNQL
jgi:hypothetical protein